MQALSEHHKHLLYISHSAEGRVGAFSYLHSPEREAQSWKMTKQTNIHFRKQLY